MQSLGNTEWLLNRAASKPLVQPIGELRNPRLAFQELVLPAINGAQSIPAWVILTTIILATTAICGTAILRARGELSASTMQRQRVEAEIANLRDSNQALARDILRLTQDPSAIELAARERLGMVRANDIVVSAESIQQSANVNRRSFVR